MCCYKNRRAKAKLLESFGHRKTRICWKILGRDGVANLSGYKYHPGRHRAKVKQYNINRPRGIHVYTESPLWISYSLFNRTVIPVVCNRNHLVRADSTEAVFTEIVILKKDWEKTYGKAKR